MRWIVTYHPDVKKDFAKLGKRESTTVMRVIDERIAGGEPDKLGKPLSGALKGYRRIRTGQTRIVYRVHAAKIEILIVAVGMRRDSEIYDSATDRVD